MQDDEQISKYVIALSVKYQILCEKTAYILVIQKNENDGEKAVKVDIPNADSDDYKEDSNVMSKGSAPSAMPMAGNGPFSNLTFLIMVLFLVWSKN